jgi:peptidoglycan/LPS O-acetylase OafA/YrhL
MEGFGDMAHSSMEEPSNRKGPSWPEPQPRLEFAANLDILRAIAALLVLLVTDAATAAANDANGGMSDPFQPLGTEPHR